MVAQICETCKKKGLYRCCPGPDGTCESYEKKAMSRFDEFKLMTVDQFAAWLDEYGRFDGAPWIKWFEESYCDNCPSETTYVTDCTGEYDYQVECECTWCEVNFDKCRFFPDMTETPCGKDMIKMWLESEV